MTGSDTAGPRCGASVRRRPSYRGPALVPVIPPPSACPLTSQPSATGNRSLSGSSALIPTILVCLPLLKFDQSITGASDVVRANAAMIFEEMVRGIEDDRRHGITIGMGTDSALTYVTHYDTWREMDLLVRYGGIHPAPR